jgi:hypothetical protein
MAHGRSGSFPDGGATNYAGRQMTSLLASSGPHGHPVSLDGSIPGAPSQMPSIANTQFYSPAKEMRMAFSILA